ncbi:hypothetical protein Dimus_001036 [Dionaea muscipula]
MYVAACKEFYKNLTMSISKKKEVAKSSVKGVKIELDGMILASILGVPGNNGIYEYINDNVAPRFGKRDTTSFMYLTYMNHLLTRRLVNLPRVMLRHMAYVISVPSYELPYGDWLTRVYEAYNVPLDDKQGEKPKSYNYFKETFLSMCQLKREHGVWWLGTDENRRRDDENEGVNNENALAENVEENPEGFDWVPVNDEADLQGEEIVREAEVKESGSGEKFYDVKDEIQSPTDMIVEVPEVSAFPASPADSTNVQTKGKTMTTGVEPSGPSSSLPHSLLQHFQADLDRARTERLQAELDNARAENARLQALLQQATSHPKP